MEFFECKHCSKILKSERAFINHYCEELKRHEILSTAKGQLAFQIFSRWAYIVKYIKPTREQFKRSKYFTSFVKFATYYKRIDGLSDLDEFLCFMVKRQFLPNQWLNSSVIEFYLSAMDCIDPKGKIERSVEFILKLSDKCECDTSEIFNYLDVYILMDCVKMHKISPWLLLNSKTFIKWFKDCEELDQNHVLDYINIDKWLELFNNEPRYKKLAKKYCNSLGI